ncbi:MAG: hypothetical protein ACT4P6_00815 [Gemmatimonadaceae bacterium]
MSRVLRSLGLSAVTATMLAGSAHAQSAGFRSVTSAPGSATVQRSGGSPLLTLYGGLASGDGRWDMGPALAASFNWNLRDAPFNVRLDPYFSYHSFDASNVDGSLWFLGATGNLEFAFRPSGTSSEPYIFGGGGLYMTNWSIDDGDEPDNDHSDLEGVFGFGGGVRFGGFTLEAKLQDVSEFTNVSFLVGFRLGG